MLIVADDTHRIEGELAAGELACPECQGELRPWGHARLRRLRTLDGVRLIRPRRSSCVGCGRTHVLIPGVMIPRRADATAVIGQALLAHAAGKGHRPIAAELGRPPATVRGWLRAFAARAAQTLRHATRWLVRLDVGVVRIEPDPHASPAAQTLEVMAAAALAAEKRVGRAVCRWQVVCSLTAGLMLANTSRPYPALR
ncbi:MAG: hypothetical protein EA387_10375 [Nitriliruptor sp.]|nr:MAG: hypothetical protein EA387_10375 [Nitriliruptor sp.]